MDRIARTLGLPPEVVRMTKRIMIDTLGCAIGGYSAKPSQIAVKLAAITIPDGLTLVEQMAYLRARKAELPG